MPSGAALLTWMADAGTSVRSLLVAETTSASGMMRPVAENCTVVDPLTGIVCAGIGEMTGRIAPAGQKAPGGGTGGTGGTGGALQAAVVT